jgi:hypothetical protein
MRAPMFLAPAILLAACSGGGAEDAGDSGTAADAASGQDGGGGGRDAGLKDGSSGDVGVAINATIQGSAFSGMDGIFVITSATGLDFDGLSTDILITDFSGACGKQTMGQGVANGQSLLIGLASVDMSGHSDAATHPGDYLVSKFPLPRGRLVAEVYYEKDGPDCQKMTTLQASTGTVTITNLTGAGASSLAGRLDVMFGADHVAGSFGATACVGLIPNRTPTANCH